MHDQNTWTKFSKGLFGILPPYASSDGKKFQILLSRQHRIWYVKKCNILRFGKTQLLYNLASGDL